MEYTKKPAYLSHIEDAVWFKAQDIAKERYRADYMQRNISAFDGRTWIYRVMDCFADAIVQVHRPDLIRKKWASARLLVHFIQMFRPIERLLNMLTKKSRTK